MATKKTAAEQGLQQKMKVLAMENSLSRMRPHLVSE